MRPGPLPGLRPDWRRSDRGGGLTNASELAAARSSASSCPAGFPTRPAARSRPLSTRPARPAPGPFGLQPVLFGQQLQQLRNRWVGRHRGHRRYINHKDLPAGEVAVTDPVSLSITAGTSRRRAEGLNGYRDGEIVLELRRLNDDSWTTKGGAAERFKPKRYVRAPDAARPHPEADGVRRECPEFAAPPRMTGLSAPRFGEARALLGTARPRRCLTAAAVRGWAGTLRCRGTPATAGAAGGAGAGRTRSQDAARPWVRPCARRLLQWG